ncbi:MAG: hypothetical protein ACXADY_05015 [Candidatus Hodarchaeales archaeon]|jgi:galactose-1-phosphate uridylyltransferase
MKKAGNTSQKDLDEKLSLLDKTVPNGHWGIFYDLNQAPERRWDTFRTINTENETRIGHQSYICPIRADRPIEYINPTSEIRFKSLKEGEDTFCQMISGKIPSIILSKDLTLKKDPLSIKAAIEDLRETKVFTTINLFTPMTRVILPNKVSPTNHKPLATGIPLLHIFKNHYQNLEEVPEEEMILFLKNIILTVDMCHKALSGDDVSINTVFHFYNIGSNAGASIPHLHSQTLLYNNKGSHGWKNHGFLLAFKKHKQIVNNNSFCLGCEYSKKVAIDPLGQELHIKDRLIFEDDYWMAFTAYAPERDGQIRLLPKRHVSSLGELDSTEITSLARALISSNTSLSRFIKKFGNKLCIHPDRNIIFRQEHYGDGSRIHMLVDIIPAQQVGGAEILDDYRISHIFPEETAERMRLF